MILYNPFGGDLATLVSKPFSMLAAHSSRSNRPEWDGEDEEDEISGNEKVEKYFQMARETGRR